MTADAALIRHPKPHQVLWIQRFAPDTVPEAERKSFETLPWTKSIASPVRREELLKGRFAARKAIVKLLGQDPGWFGFSAFAERMPDWPVGVAGTLSHSVSTGCSVAAAWVSTRNEALGIDVQPWLGDAQAERIRREMEERGAAITPTFVWGAHPAKMTTFLFGIHECVQKILGNLGLSLSPISDFELKDFQFPHWEVRLKTKPHLKLRGALEAQPEFAIVYGQLEDDDRPGDSD